MPTESNKNKMPNPENRDATIDTANSFFKLLDCFEVVTS